MFDADLNRFLSFDITSTSGNTYGFVDSGSPGSPNLVSTVAAASLPCGTAQMFLHLAAASARHG